MTVLSELVRVLPWTRQSNPPEPAPLNITTVHAEHADYVWRLLQRLGVRHPDLEDLFQEVFLIVHKRLHTFDRGSPMRAWLYGICMKISVMHRRRAYSRREIPSILSESSSEDVLPDPEQAAVQRQRREELAAILDALDPGKRVVLVMFEIEELSCSEIADELNVPIGTVYSRLNAARKAFSRACSRHKARKGDR